MAGAPRGGAAGKSMMSSPHTVKGHEGRIICSIYAGVWICLT
jgi:hypothetical protein